MTTRSIFIARLSAILSERLADPDLNGEQIAFELNMSRMHLHRHLKRYCEASAGEVIQSARMERGSQYLRSTELSVKQIAYAVGYRDPAYFARVFKRHYGVSPRALRNQKKG